MNSFILFGFKGCGKTYWGERFARELGIPFIDTDQRIIERYGEQISCREISLTLGESEFRRLERLAIAALSGVTDAVIALGGGAILFPENRSILEKMGTLIYLMASHGTLQKRLLINPLPSFLDPQAPVQSFEDYYQKRLPLYQSIPAHVIDVDQEQVISQFKEIIANGK